LAILNDFSSGIVDNTTLDNKAFQEGVRNSITGWVYGEDHHANASGTKVTTGGVTTGIVTLDATQTLTNKTLTAPLTQGTVDGWISSNDTWAYASATTITVPSGAASKYSVGDKIKYTAGGVVHYHYVISIADTVLTVCGDAVHNDTMTLNYYSKESSPLNFPDWFAATATFTVSTYDDGSGGQPATTECRFKILGRMVTVHYKGTGVKAGTDASITVTSMTIPSIANTTTHCAIGICLCIVGSANTPGVVSGGNNSFYMMFSTAITDNTTISHFGFTLNYEI
jgi:hypothetical protein